MSRAIGPRGVPGRRHAVPKDMARIAKQMLFARKPAAHVSAVLGISQASISRIKTGALHPEVPWPNGDQGKMPNADAERAIQWSDATTAYQAMPELLQVRILEVVNLRRAAADLPPIPEMAQEYIEYLEREEEEDDLEKLWEPTEVERAKFAEDKRISLIMSEFHEILEEDLAVQREEEVFRILHSTWADKLDGAESLGKEERRTLVYKKLPIEEALELGPGVKILREALANDDKALQEACCIAFWQLRRTPQNWGHPRIAVEVRKLAKRLAAEWEGEGSAQEDLHL